jgi:hypothetical protein
MTKDEAWKLANEWVAAWNAHDLEMILEHYEEKAELTSPVAAQLLGRADGKIVGKANLRAYFQRGLEAYPELHFTLEDLAVASMSETERAKKAPLTSAKGGAGGVGGCGFAAVARIWRSARRASADRVQMIFLIGGSPLQCVG